MCFHRKLSTCKINFLLPSSGYYSEDQGNRVLRNFYQSSTKLYGFKCQNYMTLIPRSNPNSNLTFVAFQRNFLPPSSGYYSEGQGNRVLWNFGVCQPYYPASKHRSTWSWYIRLNLSSNLMFVGLQALTRWLWLETVVGLTNSYFPRDDS